MNITTIVLGLCFMVPTNHKPVMSKVLSLKSKMWKPCPKNHVNALVFPTQYIYLSRKTKLMKKNIFVMSMCPGMSCSDNSSILEMPPAPPAGMDLWESPEKCSFVTLPAIHDGWAHIPDLIITPGTSAPGGRPGVARGHLSQGRDVGELAVLRY